MHIPDGLMSLPIFAAGWLLMVIFIAIALRVVKRRMDRKMVPFMGLLAASIFTAQMLNFPIGGGTSGHMVGAALLGYLLGPWAGMIVMFTVLVVQCLLFGDGGVTALGLNFVNMALIGCLIGAYVPKAFPSKWRAVGVFSASWLAVFIGALACAAELAISYGSSGGDFGISGTIAFTSLLLFHSLIGIGEGMLAATAATALSKAFPDFTHQGLLADGSLTLGGRSDA